MREIISRWRVPSRVRPRTGTQEYVYGSYVDELLSYTVGATRYFTHANHLYSIAATTNAAGAVVERYAYDAYGTQTVTNAAGTVELAESGVGQTRGFTGYILDQETGLYHARARQYDSRLGRFLGRDSIGYTDGLSLYKAFFIPNQIDWTGNSASSGAEEEDKCPTCIGTCSVKFRMRPDGSGYDYWGKHETCPVECECRLMISEGNRVPESVPLPDPRESARGHGWDGTLQAVGGEGWILYAMCTHKNPNGNPSWSDVVEPEEADGGENPKPPMPKPPVKPEEGPQKPNPQNPQWH